MENPKWLKLTKAQEKEKANIDSHQKTINKKNKAYAKRKKKRAEREADLHKDK